MEICESKIVYCFRAIWDLSASAAQHSIPDKDPDLWPLVRFSLRSVRGCSCQSDRRRSTRPAGRAWMNVCVWWWDKKWGRVTVGSEEREDKGGMTTGGRRGGRVKRVSTGLQVTFELRGRARLQIFWAKIGCKKCFCLPKNESDLRISLVTHTVMSWLCPK